ncbi:MAG: hypothetical protein AAGF12_32705 [Myxococcota bacterium]
MEIRPFLELAGKRFVVLDTGEEVDDLPEARVLQANEHVEWFQAAVAGDVPRTRLLRRDGGTEPVELGEPTWLFRRCPEALRGQPMETGSEATRELYRGRYPERPVRWRVAEVEVEGFAEDFVILGTGELTLAALRPVEDPALLQVAVDIAAQAEDFEIEPEAALALRRFDDSPFAMLMVDQAVDFDARVLIDLAREKPIRVFYEEIPQPDFGNKLWVVDASSPPHALFITVYEPLSTVEYWDGHRAELPLGNPLSPDRLDWPVNPWECAP